MNRTDDLDQRTFQKVVAMFSPVESDFLGFSKEEVIQGPNDRAMYGFDTYFPVKWLVEDYGFTDEEARHFVNMVKKKKGDAEDEDRIREGLEAHTGPDGQQEVWAGHLQSR